MQRFEIQGTIRARILNQNPAPISIRMTKNASQTPDFEAALQELETIVERMETGNQTLEESLKDFERGMQLSKQCQASLKQAQQRIDKLLPDNGQAGTDPELPDDPD